MIVAQFNVVRVFSFEPEADAPLIVYRYSPLAFTIARKLVEPIPRRHAKIFDAVGAVDHIELANGALHHVSREFLALPRCKQGFCCFIGERPYHVPIVTYNVTHDN